MLSIDADEVVTEDLKTELIRIFGKAGDKATESQSNKVTEVIGAETESSLPCGFIIPFALHYMGRILKHGGVGNEFHLRLFNRTKGGFTTVPVHEGIEVKGSVGIMKGRIIHYSYRDISHHLEKINTYTSQAAEGYHQKGKSFPKSWVVLKFPFSFISFYILKLGFLDGYPGFMWSFLAAVYSTLKVAKTIELKHKP